MLTSCGSGDSVNMAVAHSPGSCATAARSFSGEACCCSHSAAAAQPTREGARLTAPGATADHRTCRETAARGWCLESRVASGPGLQVGLRHHHLNPACA